jgi:hypothetical protein
MSRLKERIKDVVLYSRAHSLADDLTRFRGFDSLDVSFPDAGFSTTVYHPQTRSGWVEPIHDTTYYEELTVRTLVEELSPGDTFWDVGSRTGYFAQIASGVTDPSNVYVFEAMQGRARIVRTINRRYYGGAFTVEHTRLSDRSGEESTTGDDYAREHGAPDVVKLDIEGGEYLALKGLDRTLREHRPTLLIEMHYEAIEALGGSVEEMHATLEDVYDSVRIADRYRRRSETWRPLEEADGEWVEGSFQLLCTSE